MLHFPLFQIPSVSHKFSDSMENFHIFAFSQQIFRFSSAKISHDLLLKFGISPYFCCFNSFPPLFWKIFLFPLLLQISPRFPKIYVFLHTLCFSFPPTLTMMHLCITQCKYWTPVH